MKLTKIKNSRSRVYRLLTVTHAAPDGGPVLLGESSWRTISGLLINTQRGLWSFEFRRVSA